MLEISENANTVLVMGFQESVYAFLVSLNQLKAKYLEKGIRLVPQLRITDFCVLFIKA